MQTLGKTNRRYSDADILRVKVDGLREILQPAARRMGREHYVCPVCGKGQVYRPLWDKGIYYCPPAGCNKTRSIFDYESEVNGLSFLDVMERRLGQPGTAAAQVKSQRQPGPPQSIVESARDVEQWQQVCKAYLMDCVYNLEGSRGLEYLIQDRGLSRQICRRFRLGFDAEALDKAKPFGGCLDRGRAAVIYPYSPAMDYYGARLLKPIGDTKALKPKTEIAGSEPLFNGGGLYGVDVCFVVEGPFDAMSVYQAISGNNECVRVGAVALCSTGGDRLVKRLKAKPTKAKLIVCLDDDPPGRRGALNVAEALAGIGADYSIVTSCYDRYKDFNAALVGMTDGDFSSLVWEIVQSALNNELLSLSEYAEALACSETE